MNKVIYNFPLDPNSNSESELITALYLYGENVQIDANGKPIIPQKEELLDSNLIRPELIVPQDATNDTQLNIPFIEAHVDAPQYMTIGPGQYANGSQFDLVKAFFGQGKSEMTSKNGKDNFNPNYNDSTYFDNQGNLKPGTYTREEIDKIFFQDNLDDYSANLELRNYNQIDDYGETVYVWNSQQFSLPEDVLYVVNNDGTKEIQNFRIEPNKRPELNFKENFDFETANLGVGILSGLILEPRVDPSKIGRTVYFEFDNRANLPFSVYKQSDFNNDVANENSFKGFNPFKLKDEMVKEADKLFNAGVTKFLYQDKPIVYGTVDDDNLNGTVVKKATLGFDKFPLQKDKIKNGVVLLGGKGNDTLKGNSESLNDLLVGHEGNDNLDGDSGEDIAIFSDDFINYDIDTSGGGVFGVGEKITTINHTGGTQTDGKDTLKNIEFARFKDTIVPLPLEDGEKDTLIGAHIFSGTNPNDKNEFGRLSQTLPISMLDGNAEYTVNFSAIPLDSQYNIAFIIDTSASMDATELQQAKDAYISLTNHFINTGIADVSNFAVISFSKNATLNANLTASQAITKIQGLTNAPAIEGTKYNDALYKGLQFFTSSPLKGVTNIAYFSSDGRSQHNFADPNDISYVYDAMNLRRVANVQAFGIYDSSDPGTVSPSQLDFVDSDNAVIFNNASQLEAALGKSGLISYLDRIEILNDGNVVETILPNQLTDSPLGLSFTGNIDNLDVSFNAENLVTAKAYFTNGTPPATLDFTVASGLVESTSDPLTNIVAGSPNDDVVYLNAIDLGANGGAGNDKIIGNKYDNDLDGGDGNDKISAREGNDTIIPGNGLDRVDGGEGVDTVVYADKPFAASILRKVGEAINVDNADTLTNVEFIQYSDLRISTKTLQVTPILQSNDITVAEGDSNNTTAQFTFNLSTPAPVDVQFNYTTVDGDAVAGEDYLAKSGTAIIAAGDTSASIEVEVIGDTVNESTETFAVNLSNISGATFANNKTDYSVVAKIENKAQNLTLIGDADKNTLIGGVGNDFLDGRQNDDYLFGEAGNDTLNGGSGNDALIGSSGNDRLDGGSGSDTLIGGDGNDTYVVDSPNDSIIEEPDAGSDTVNSSLSWTLTDNLEKLTLTGTNAIDATGNSLNNVLTGNSAVNNLDGGDGNDTLRGVGGDDRLYGKAGNDSLDGGSGIDTLEGGSGNDTLTGGTDIDQFFYDTNAAFSTSDVGIDRITDFTSGSDRLVLDKTTFTALTSIAGNGFSAVNEFAAVTSNSAAATVEAAIVYNNSTGNLFYNENGVAPGFGSGGQFATFTGIPTLSAEDFVIQI